MKCYEILDTTFIQPSYREDKDAGLLWIMGNGQPERLREFTERIKQVIYRDHYKK